MGVSGGSSTRIPRSGPAGSPNERGRCSEEDKDGKGADVRRKLLGQESYCRIGKFQICLGIFLLLT